jgi:hypothetical protein
LQAFLTIAQTIAHRDRAAFRATALAAGYEDHGGPGERASTKVSQMRQRFRDDA